MPNNQTNEDSKLIDRDREVDEILEESKYLLDQEKMELTAQNTEQNSLLPKFSAMQIKSRGLKTAILLMWIKNRL